MGLSLPGEVIASVTLLGGIVVWALRVEARLSLLDRIVQDHLTERAKWAEQLTVRLDRMETKIDNIRIRCAAFHHQYPEALQVLRDAREDGNE